MLSLLRLATIPVGQLTDEDLLGAAKAITGGESEVVLDFFKALRASEPSVPVTELLRTPSALAVLKAGVQRLQQSTEGENGIMCRCPNCHFAFITE